MTKHLGLGQALLNVSVLAFALAGPAAACGTNTATLPFNPDSGTGGGDGGGGDGGIGKSDGDWINTDGPTISNDGTTPVDGSMDCSPNSSDVTGCQCQVGATHACYDGPPNTKGVGPCKAGTQTCMLVGEFGKFGPCMGQVGPTPDPNHCTDGMDTECTGLIGCMDPACANTPACMPPPDASDGPPPPPQDGGCTPPITTITGAQRCPDGTILNPTTNLCCPCTANDCPSGGGNYGCCSSPACATDAMCTSCPSMTLDPACNGMVDGDCDDFPEDCDQLCCPCKPATCGRCPQGQVMCDDGTGQMVCTNVATSPATCGACDFMCNTGMQCVNGLCM